jgi:hypothetical protein
MHGIVNHCSQRAVSVAEVMLDDVPAGTCPLDDVPGAGRGEALLENAVPQVMRSDFQCPLSLSSNASRGTDYTRDGRDDPQRHRVSVPIVAIRRSSDRAPASMHRDR